MSALWRFSIDPDRASEGWLDPSAGGFRSKPISSLAREIIQNSLDAKNENDPLVRVTFKAHEVETSKLPDISSLRHAISRCVNSEQIHSNHNIDLMRIAKNTIYQDRIKVLSIKEEGTKGMEGPCEPGKDVYNYMKVVAISGKSSNEGNRGSHGIGKAAPLVCSKINTIFASTKYAGNAEQILGRASLCSHFDDEGAIRKGTGYWGKDGEPVEYDQLFPEWLNRKSPGTDIHILGFREPDYWVTTLLGSIIKNFFVVICEGKLEVEIELDSQSKVSLKDALELNEEKISPPLPKNYRIDKETIGKYFLSERDI